MDFMIMAERVGVPLAILGAVGLGLWKVMTWIGVNVVTPITASHIALVESTKKSNELNSVTLEKMTAILQVKSVQDVTLHENTVKILDLVTRTHEHVTKKTEA